MNLETRDRLDTLLDDAKRALDEAERLIAYATVDNGSGNPNDWTVYGRIHGAGSDLRGAIDALPTVHSLKASEARANCLACQNPGMGVLHAIDCPEAL